MSSSKNSTYSEGPRCGFEGCPSKKYYDDNGFKFCKYGHQQEVRGMIPQEKIRRILLVITLTPQRQDLPLKLKKMMSLWAKGHAKHARK